jgi:CRP-like cAMP-binding protein
MDGGLSYDRDLMKRLKKFELFSLFTDHEIGQLLEAGEFVTCHQGEQIIKENETDSDFFVLLEGNVRVQKQQRVLSNFLPGSCFGEIGAFARRRRSAAVIAEGDCKLLRINALLFQELDPSVQLKMLSIVVRNLSSLVISLDNEIMRLTDGKGRSDKLPTICPLCGYDNQAPIEVCPHCGVIPSACEDADLSEGPGP